jgi:hypothetical protein
MFSDTLPAYDIEHWSAIATTTNVAAVALNDDFASRIGTPHAYEAYNEVLPIDAAGTDVISHASIIHHVSQDATDILEAPGVPHHRLHLHVRNPIHLLTNIDPSSGLCKGEHAVALLKRTLAISLLRPLHPDHANWVLSHINFDLPVKNFPTSIRRHQFPVAVAFPSTTHRIQGADKYRLLIDLGHHAFTHGQVYVDLTHVKDCSKVCNLVPDKDIGPGGKSWVTNSVLLRKNALRQRAL